MSCTRKGIRFSKPSKRVSESGICAVTCSTVMGGFQGKGNEAGWNASTPPVARRSAADSDESLVQHGIGNLEEAADVGSVHQIAGSAVLLGGFVAVFVDGDHDFVQPLVHFLPCPAQPHAVLDHLQSGSGHD